MKRFPIFLFILFLDIICHSQNLSVESFIALDNDLTANTTGTMKRDQNGDIAALIKVVTTETGFVFDVGSMGIVTTENKPGEIWVYVPAGVQRITLSHTVFGVLRDFYFPIPINKGRTYELKLSTTGSTKVNGNIFKLRVTPENAKVEIDGQTYKTDALGSIGDQILSIGNHKYKLSAQNYYDQTGSFTITDNHRIDTTFVLISKLAQVTIHADSGTDIFLNDSLIGTQYAQVSIPTGSYTIKACKDGFHPSSITANLNEQQIFEYTFRDLETITGSLSVQYHPSSITVEIDGIIVANKNGLINDIPIGKHVITIRKAGYDSDTRQVTITQDNTLEISGVLEDLGSRSFSMIQTGGLTPLSYGLFYGNCGKMGYYVSARSNFIFNKADYILDDMGKTSDGEQLWYTGKSRIARHSLTGGLITRASKHLYVYGGAGYSIYSDRIETYNGKWAKANSSIENICFDLGAIYRYRWFSVSGGINCTQPNVAEFVFGFGLAF